MVFCGKTRGSSCLFSLAGMRTCPNAGETDPYLRSVSRNSTRDLGQRSRVAMIWHIFAHSSQMQTIRLILMSFTCKTTVVHIGSRVDDDPPSLLLSSEHRTNRILQRAAFLGSEQLCVYQITPLDLETRTIVPILPCFLQYV